MIVENLCRTVLCHPQERFESGSSPGSKTQSDCKMGTRHLIVVVHKGRQVIAQYGQYGGDQDEAGLAFREILTTESFLGKLKHGLAYIEDVSLEEQEDVDAGPHGKALEKSSSFLRFMMHSSEELSIRVSVAARVPMERDRRRCPWHGRPRPR